MVFTSEDFKRLKVMFNILNKTVNHLIVKNPLNFMLEVFQSRLSSFGTTLFHPLIERYIEIDMAEEIGNTFPQQLEESAKTCFKALDRISDDIYSYIQDNKLGFQLRDFNNTDFF